MTFQVFKTWKVSQLNKNKIMASLNHYLHFDGNASEAFNFYKSVFGNDFSSFSRYKDMPSGAPAPEGDEGELILHVSLPIGNGTILMGGDRPGKFGKGTRGDLSHIYVEANNKEEAAELFQALSEGGKIIMPIEDTFWGSYFGMLVDKFGVQWMVSYAYPQP